MILILLIRVTINISYTSSTLKTKILFFVFDIYYIIKLSDRYPRLLLYQLQQTGRVSLENSKEAFSVDKCKLVFYDYKCKRKKEIANVSRNIRC